MKQLHIKEREMRRTWIVEGRPRGMIFESYRNYQRAKRSFRVTLHNEFNIYMRSVYRDVDNTASYNIRLFWKLVKRPKKRTSHTYPEIRVDNGNIYNKPSGVAKAFAIYYENYFSFSDYDSFDD